MEGGGSHDPVRGTLFLGGSGAVTLGPSRECNITSFLKGRPKSAQQLRDSVLAAHSVQSVTAPSSEMTCECRSPGSRSPPPKESPMAGDPFTGHLRNHKPTCLCNKAQTTSQNSCHIPSDTILRCSVITYESDSDIYLLLQKVRVLRVIP